MPNVMVCHVPEHGLILGTIITAPTLNIFESGYWRETLCGTVSMERRLLGFKGDVAFPGLM
jgi:hypothetical protein